MIADSQEHAAAVPRSRGDSRRPGPTSGRVKVAVVEGESPRPEHCIALGECVIRDLPPGLPKGTPIEVTYEYAGQRPALGVRPGALASANRPTSRSSGSRRARGKTWRRGIGSFARWKRRPRRRAADTLPEDADRATLLKRLDSLYIQAGTRAALLSVPPKLRRSLSRPERPPRNSIRPSRASSGSPPRSTPGPTSAKRGSFRPRYPGEAGRCKTRRRNPDSRTWSSAATASTPASAPPELARHVAEILLIRKRLEV